MGDVAVLGVIRPPFLILTPICAILGIAVAAAGETSIDWTAAVMALVGALSAHVSVNAINEYEDFRSGLDLCTERTPFSGGSGTLVAHPELAGQARAIGLAALGMTVVCGLLLLWRAGLGLLPIGGGGLALVYFYTSRISQHRWLCLVAPGLGFGPLMVAGTHYAVTGGWSWSVLIASMVPFFLVSNLLLLNQFPDVEADRSVARDNLPIALGLGDSLRVYGWFAALAYACLVLGVGLGLLPLGAMIALVTLPLAVAVYVGVGRAVRRKSGVPSNLVPFLGLNVFLALLMPALLSIGVLLER